VTASKAWSSFSHTTFPPRRLRPGYSEHGLTQVLFNAPPGDWGAGERGIASLPGREDEFRRGIGTALDYARALGCDRVHVMAGLLPAGAPRARHRAVYLANLDFAARAAARQGVTILIEPINTRDMPGFFLNRQDDAQAIRVEIGTPNLLVQFDLYHAQIVEGNLAAKLRRDIDGIGHIQIAGVPERHEPDTGEVNFTYLMQLVDALDYQGWVGAEYRPRGATSDGLAWLRAWG
jgi:hydroxypyruvate isomerase